MASPGSDSSSVKALDSACFRENRIVTERWGEGGVKDLGTSFKNHVAQRLRRLVRDLGGKISSLWNRD